MLMALMMAVIFPLSRMDLLGIDVLDDRYLHLLPAGGLGLRFRVEGLRSEHGVSGLRHPI